MSISGRVQDIRRGHGYEDKSTGKTEGPKLRMEEYSTLEGVTSTTRRVQGTW